ncbi:MAG: hypothetical protein ABI396_17285, partial [Ktedonobacteraceae bacterium]
MSRDKTRRYNNWDDDDEQQDVYDDEYDDDEQDAYDEPPRRRRPPAAPPRRRRRKQRKVWPWLLAGCAGGIIILVLAAAIVVFVALRTATNGGNLGSIGGIANPTTYTQNSTQPLQLTNITQMNIHDPIGNITITVDPGATQATVAIVKKVKASSSDDANKEFGNVAVQVQPSGTAPNMLAVSATVPDAGGILGTHNDSVDLTITLPPNTIAQASSASTPLTLAADTSIGNITVNGLNGILGIKNNIGNITVNNATLFDGSHLETGTGNVQFSGSLNLTPSNGNTIPRYKLQCESGQI